MRGASIATPALPHSRWARWRSSRRRPLRRRVERRRGVVRVVGDEHACGVAEGQVVELVTQKPYAAVARVAQPQRGAPGELPLVAQAPLLRVGHLKVGIDNRDRVARGLRMLRGEGATRGGSTKPSSSLCAITSAPISRVLTPQLVAHT